ncbi:hypothetical protein predicted by Glimmer/Critica [Salmonella enterica subsp. enterica serovar Weltevreden str. 2007-60-3289-1]|nr:hypothetical protein predicted by Glimmer/Critica [Salmonella enterica subsp. enterica serovar Weltevreden str. 2007-60-3289-1]
MPLATTPVYPRWRGEHKFGTGSIPRERGLSPLARGTPTRVEFDGIPMRFIPAGAGNTGGGAGNS